MIDIKLNRRRLRSISIRELTSATHALTGATTVRIDGDQIFAEGHRALSDAEVVEVMRIAIASEIGTADAAWAVKPRLRAAGLA
jgi:hypothetical protein